MKHDTPRPDAAAPVAEVAAGGDMTTDESATIATEVINIMEQGILVWSAEGICRFHNARIFEVLGLAPDDLWIGIERDRFRDRAEGRAEMSASDRQATADKIRLHQNYAFDRTLPSGRVVRTNGRPARGGAYVVTFSDVTDARRAAQDLAAAKKAAEAAQAHTQEVLAAQEAHQHEADLLGQLDNWLQSCKSLDELFRVVATFMARLLPASKGELYIYSNSRDVLDGACRWNTNDLHPTIAPDSCWALRRGRSYEYDETGLCFPCEHVEAHHHGVAVHEYICVPIVAHGDTVGLLHIRFEPEADSAARITGSAAFARQCGEHISLAIANVKLRDELQDQSIRDPLTGLYNRRYFLDALRREIGQSDRHGTPFGLISFDADNFKMFNDNHGHDAGDMVLRALCDTLRAVLPSGATGCRVGGEEFAVLLPGADLTAAAALAETLGGAVADTTVRYVDGPLPRVTISAGVASYPDCGPRPQDLIRKADAALYRAKAQGRNCVQLAGCATGETNGKMADQTTAAPAVPAD